MNNKSNLFVKLFAGSHNEKNIGHEVINYFVPDNSNDVALYIPEHGKINQSVKNVFFFEETSYPGIKKLIFVAKNISHFNNEQDRNEFINKIKYNGKKLNDINFNLESSNAKQINLISCTCSINNYYDLRKENFYFVVTPKKNLVDRQKIVLGEFIKKPIQLDLKEWHTICYCDFDISKQLELNDGLLIDKNSQYLKGTPNPRH